LALVIVLAATTAVGLSIAYYRTALSLEQAERALYFHQIAAAHQRWLDNDRQEADDLLDACPEGMRRFEWDFLKGLFATPSQHIRNAGPGVCYSPDGQRIYAGGGDEPAIKVFDAATCKPLFNFPGPTSWISPLDISPDGQMVVSGCTHDRSVRLWDARGGQPIRLLGHLRRDPMQTQFSRDGTTVVAVDRNATVYAWNTATGEEVGRLRPRSGEIRAIAVSPVDSRVAVSATRQGQPNLTIWDTRAGEKPLDLSAEGRTGSALAFSPDGALLAAAEAWGPIGIWSGSPPRPARYLAGAVTEKARLAFDPKAERIAAEAPDGTIRVWSVATGKELSVFRGRRSTTPNWLRFSPDGRFLAATDVKHVVRFWDTTIDQGALALRGGRSQVTDLCFAPQSDLVAASFADGKVGVWDTSNCSKCWLLPVTGGPLWALAFAPDGRRLAVAGDDGAVRVLETESGHQQSCFAGYCRPLRTVAFSPDGRHLASVGTTGEVLFCDAETGHVLQSFSSGSGIVNSLAFDPAGTRLAVGTQDRGVFVWDLLSRTAVWRYTDRRVPVRHVAFSPCGKFLAVARSDGYVRIHDATDGSRRSGFGFLANDELLRAAFSPDGSRLVTATRHMSVVLWEAPTGRAVLTLCRDATVAGAVAGFPRGVFNQNPPPRRAAGGGGGGVGG
jgi:WD40 repeat protein